MREPMRSGKRRKLFSLVWSLKFLLANFLVTNPSSAEVYYEINELEGLRKEKETQATAINNRSSVVGFSKDEEGNVFALLWEGKKTIELGVSEGESLSQEDSASKRSIAFAFGINEKNQIVGGIAVGGSWPIVPFFWEDNEFYTIPTLLMGGMAYDINNNMQIVGYSEFAFFIYIQYATLWEMAEDKTIKRVIDLCVEDQNENSFDEIDELIREYNSEAYAINNKGKVVGRLFTYLAEEPLSYGFFWENGTITPLDSLGGEQSLANDINDNDIIVGEAQTKEGKWHAFMWQSGEMIDLGTLRGEESSAQAINNLNQIVGSSTSADGTRQAVLWENGRIFNLNSLIPPGLNVILETAVDINDKGDIVCNGKNAKGEKRAFLLRRIVEFPPPSQGKEEWVIIKEVADKKEIINRVGEDENGNPDESLKFKENLPSGWVLKLVIDKDGNPVKKRINGISWQKVEDVTNNTIGWIKERYLIFDPEGIHQEEWREKTQIVIFKKDHPQGFTFTKQLSVGSRGDEVRLLQAILKEEPPYRLDGKTIVIYPEGLITGYFGKKTKEAVKRFQEKYSQEILEPLGLDEGTGIVGEKTREKLNSRLRDPYFAQLMMRKYELKIGRETYCAKIIEELKPDFSLEAFPTELILALIAQESNFDNEVNQDGLMQVTEESMCHHEGVYNNSKQGILINIKDGLKVLQECYKYSRRDILGALWRYNGGPQPYQIYYQCKGDSNYLGHIAERYVQKGYGDENSQIVSKLRKAQKDITETMKRIEERQKLSREEICRVMKKGEYEKLKEIKDKENIIKYTGGRPLEKIWIPGDSISRGKVYSPVEFRVYNSKSQVTGIINGKIKKEIPDSYYEDNTITILFPDDEYLYEIKGTEEGEYKLEIVLFDRKQVSKFTAVDIPVSFLSIHQYSIDWQAFSKEKEEVLVKIDSDGDGDFEREILSDNYLTKEEFIFEEEQMPSPVCGAGLCGVGTFPFLPFIFLILAIIKKKQISAF